MFRVEWIQAALDDVTNLWMQGNSSMRHAITTATHTLEQELQSDPNGKANPEMMGNESFSPIPWLSNSK